MADIKDCIGKKVKIGKSSITIKNAEGKTCGIVRNVVSLYDLQANKQMNYYKQIKQAGLHGVISVKDCIIHNGTMYIFRNVKGKLFNEKHGYFSEEEKQKVEDRDNVYNHAAKNGIDVIECLYV